jgi:hypothetical protein
VFVESDTRKDNRYWNKSYYEQLLIIDNGSKQQYKYYRSRRDLSIGLLEDGILCRIPQGDLLEQLTNSQALLFSAYPEWRRMRKLSDDVNGEIVVDDPVARRRTIGPVHYFGGFFFEVNEAGKRGIEVAMPGG